MSATSTDTTKKPQEGQTIVWRFRGHRGWSRSHVREILAKGKLVELTSGFSGEIVALADIEWYVA